MLNGACGRRSWRSRRAFPGKDMERVYEVLISVMKKV